MRRTLVLLTLLALSLGLASAVTVSGKILDENGKPIKGANVLIALPLYGEEQKTYDLLTDAEGGYAVDVDLSTLRSNANPGWICAYAPGYALAAERLNKSDNTLTLIPGTTVSGVVVDVRGKPLAGVAVRLGRCSYGDNQYGSPPDEWRSRFSAVSGADGVWTLPGVPRDGQAWVVSLTDRYLHDIAEITLVAGEKTEPAGFIVRPGARVSGRVLTPSGAPAADAQVGVYSSANNGVLNLR